MKELQEMQAAYDKKYWQIQPIGEDLRHILLHLAKLNGKMAAFVEPFEHGEYDQAALDKIKFDVIPDLLFYALHLANKWGYQLDAQYRQRLERNAALHEKANKSE